MEVKVIKLSDIRVAMHNHRKHIDQDKLKELSVSIMEKGVIEPIIVRPTGSHFEIVCGERRYRASSLAGMEDIPAIVKTLDDKQALEFQVIENLQREDVHPLEEAEGYETLMQKHGYKTVDDIAAKVGKSKAYVYGRMKLLDLVPENRKRFYDGTFAPSVALIVARVPKDIQAKAGKSIIDDCRHQGDITLKRASEHIQYNFMLRLENAPFDKKETCAKCPKRTINEKELFADVGKEDRCTDPACFQKMKNAYLQRLCDTARRTAGTHTVLSSEESKKALSYSNKTYVKLDDNCYDYPGESSPKYRELAKKAKIDSFVYAIDEERGKIVQLVDRKVLSEALKSSGMKSYRSVQGSGQAKERKEEKIRHAVLDKIASQVIEQVRRDKVQKYMRPFVEEFLERANFDEQRVFIQRKDPTVKGEAIREETKKHVAAISDSEIFIFCLEIMLANEGVGPHYGGPKYGNLGPQLCKLYNIDIKKIESQVKAEDKAKKK